MSKEIHRETDLRACDAETDVIGNATVFANNLLVSVEDDINTHGNGQLISGANQVYVQNKLVIRIEDQAEPDDLCGEEGGDHCNPFASTGSPDVFAGFPTEVSLGINPLTGEETKGLDRGPIFYQPQDFDPDEPDALRMIRSTPGGGNISPLDDSGGPFTANTDVVDAGPIEFGDCTRPDLGKISERYESNGNPGAIGRDSTGGYSYGTYQIATKVGTFNNYMKFLQQRYPNYHAELESAGGSSAALAGTPDFQAKWKELAKEPDFKTSQHDFIQATHHDPLVKKVKAETGFDICDANTCPGLQDAVWSVGVQHGPGSSIITKGIQAAGPGASQQDIINAIYDERSKTEPDGKLSYFRRSTPSVQTSVKNRFNRERQDALNACPL